MIRVLLATALAASAFAFTTTTGAVADAAPAVWSVVATPSPRGAAASQLIGVACSGPNACTAVGEFQTRAGIRALAERWNGTAFSIQPTPNPTNQPVFSVLSGVSCPAVNACTAVGEYATTAFNGFTLAERWNGSAWLIQRTPNRSRVPANLLSAVACPTPNACTAVGSYRNGDQNLVLAERWNGAAWSLQAIPNPPGAFTSFLTGVSCTGVDACTAVGYFSGTQGERLPLAERWNGTTWSLQSVPSQTDEGGSLSGVSCSANNACTAVGQFLDHPAAQRFALAERWNGSAWSIQPSPTPPGGTDPSLSGVSCPTATACSAVGDVFNRSNADLTLAERWDGSAWSVQSTPSPGRVANVLSAVACSSTTACLAVGTMFQGQGKFFALGERFQVS